MRISWLVLGCLLACSGSTTSTPAPGPTSTGAPDPVPTTTTTAPPPPPPAGPYTPSAADGAPTRQACTSAFGTALSTSHGRLDGVLVSIVPQNNGKACNGDSSHLHLQVEANAAIYDIAVNLDALLAEIDVALPSPAWTEGWHASARLDYPKDLGLHAPAFAGSAPSAQRSHLETTLAAANHVAIYATGYNTGGAHLVHFQGSGDDGAIVLDPLGAKPHVLAFRFVNDSF